MLRLEPELVRGKGPNPEPTDEQSLDIHEHRVREADGSCTRGASLRESGPCQRRVTGSRAMLKSPKCWSTSQQ